MEPVAALEDERGVDVSQISALLAMSVAERVAEMVRVSNMVLEVQQQVRSSSAH